MDPETAQQQRQQALNNAILGLQRLSSYELDPQSTRASGVLYELQSRIAQIEAAEEAAGQQRHSEQQRAAAFRDAHGRYTAPGTQPINRGEGGPRPVPSDFEAGVQQTMDEIAARGLGRI
jgi:septal ring factor EnvC (AmiA/AmiB activator)